MRLVVWRHAFLSYANRLLYLGELSIEHEVAKLERRCHKLGVSIQIIQTLAYNVN